MEQKWGSIIFTITPDPPNAPDVIFNMQDADLGQFALYQDTNRAGGIVFDNIVLNQLKVDVPPPPSAGQVHQYLDPRRYVGTGDEVMIGSFIIREGAQQVLIQALGPELANQWNCQCSGRPGSSLSSMPIQDSGIDAKTTTGRTIRGRL